MNLELPFEIEEPSGGTVPYQVAHINEDTYAGPEISLGYEQGNSASQTYWCNWDDLDAFTFAILGLTEEDTESSQAQWRRWLPHKYIVPAFGNFYASNITGVKGIPGPNPNYNPGTDDPDQAYLPQFDGTELRFRWAAVTVQYTPTPWPMLTDEQIGTDERNGVDVAAEWRRFVTIRKMPRFEFQDIAHQAGLCFWVNTPPNGATNAVPGTAVKVRSESTDYVVTLHRLSRPITFPSSYMGYTNLYDGFLDGHPQAPAGGFDEDTMQLTGVQEYIFPVAFTDILYYSYDFLFLHKPNTHHRVPRPDLSPPTFDYTDFTLDGNAIVAGDDSNRLIKMIDMRYLFLPGV